MLRIVGHVPRDWCLHSSLGIDVPNANFGGRVPHVPNGLTPLLLKVILLYVAPNS